MVEKVAAPPKFVPPIRVSPFIRGCRWGALTLGILWGMSRNKSLTKKETRLREIEARQKEIHDAEYAKVKKQRDKEEMIYLATEAGVQIPPDFEDQYK